MTISSLDMGGITHDTSQWQAGDHIILYEVGDTGFAIYELASTPTCLGLASLSSKHACGIQASL